MWVYIEYKFNAPQLIYSMANALKYVQNIGKHLYGYLEYSYVVLRLHNKEQLQPKNHLICDKMYDFITTITRDDYVVLQK